MRKLAVYILIIVGLSLTALACTSRDYRYPRHPYPRNPYPPNYPGYPGGGGYYGSEQIRNLANSLEDATDDALDAAKDQRHHDSDREDDAIDRLEDLADEAEDFQDEIDDDRRDPRRTSDDFRDLLQKYQAARNSLRDLHAYDEVYREFEQVTRIMAEMSRFYGYRLDRDDRYYDPIIR